MMNTGMSFLMSSRSFAGLSLDSARLLNFDIYVFIYAFFRRPNHQVARH
jgi:hypothetical protein